MACLLTMPSLRRYATRTFRADLLNRLPALNHIVEDLESTAGRLERPCLKALSDILTNSVGAGSAASFNGRSQAEVIVLHGWLQPLGIEPRRNRKFLSSLRFQPESMPAGFSAGVAGCSNQIFSTHALVRPGHAPCCQQSAALHRLRKPQHDPWNFD